MIRTFSLLAMLTLTALASAQLPPDEALKKFTVADGLQIELFAAEPDVINPTSIDVDEKGRVWVCEAVNYRRKNFNRPILRKEGDRIMVLEDTNADGKADKSHVFYQGEELYGPLGIAVAPYMNDKKIAYKVYVCQSPDILLFEDKDGDLKADGPPTKFLTGFKGFDHDHGVHGINIGPDGKFYFTVGDQGVKDLQATDGKGPKFNSNQTDCRAGTVWRCDMDGKNLELIAHNFRNNYECCVNSFGEIWLSDNDDDGNQQTRICFVMPGGNYGYHPRGGGQSHWHEEQPGIVHKTLRTGFGSPTGICFYEGSLLPKKYHGQLLHTDAGPRELRAFHIKPQGAGYQLDKENLVTSSDNWFRPSDVCVAPDGSVMLADWYDPGVGGHGMGDWTRGRIYRVTPKGHKGYKVPEVKLDMKEGLLAALASPCLATRSIAFPTVSSDADKKGIAKAQQASVDLAIAVKESDTRETKARVMWRFFRVWRGREPESLEKFIRNLMKSKDPEFERLAIRAQEQFERKHVAEFYPPDGAKHLEKWGAGTLREVSLNTRIASAKEATPLFYDLAKLYDGQDRFYLAALNIACGTDPERRDAILADFDKHFPEWNDKVADLVWELRPKSVMARLPKLLEDSKLTGLQKARIVDILASSEDVNAGQTMLTLLKSKQAPEVKAQALRHIQQFLPGKWKSLQGSKDMAAAIDELLSNSTTRTEGILLIGAAQAQDRLATLAGIAATAKDGTDKSEQQARIAAVQALGTFKTPQAMDALEAMLKPGVPVGDELGIELSRALAVQMQVPGKNAKGDNLGRALTALTAVALSDTASPAIRRSAIEALSGTQPGTHWLLYTFVEKKTIPDDLMALAGRLLRNSPYQDLRGRAASRFPSPPAKLDPKKLPTLAELSQRVGNAERGKQLLALSLKGDTQCVRCHLVQGVGGQIGPDLSKIGSKASRENMYESILQPSKAIADQFLQWQIENSAGQKILGLIIEETPDTVTIRDANGKDTKIAKTDIESRTKSAISIMPEDIVKNFTEDELTDVVEYLLSLK